jgi:hypothetical protein
MKNSSERAASKPAVKEEKSHEADKLFQIVLTTTTNTMETPQPVVQTQNGYSGGECSCCSSRN